MRRRYWPLAFLAALFLSPALIAAYMLRYAPTNASRIVAHGELVQQPHTVSFKALYNLAGENFQDNPQNKWRLIYVDQTDCLASCQQDKRLLQNLHTALGADRDRIEIYTAREFNHVYKATVGSLLIVDPRDIYVMHYPPGADYNGVLKDIRRLLKYSHG